MISDNPSNNEDRDPEDQQPQKTKKISKNVGRPSKKRKPNQPQKGDTQNEQIDTTSFDSMPTVIWQQIMAHLIDFFSATQCKKGLVFSQRQRTEFIDKQFFKGWSKVHKWNYDEECKKAATVCRKAELGDAEAEELRKVMVESSGIFAQEFTNEYYQILLKVYQLTREQKNMGMEDHVKRYHQLADDIHKNKNNLYNFFSYAFLTKVNKDPKRTVVEPYQQLLLALRGELQQLP